jgi:tetratricopeptide (TPR) repeat protein
VRSAGAIALLLVSTVAGGGARAGNAVTHAPSAIEQAFRAGDAAEKAGDETAARAAYERGVTLGRTALAANPDAREALLWLPANLARAALTRSKLYALKVIPEVEATLLRLEQIDPTYDHAAAARALANLYWKAPALISVGSSKKAARYFSLALARDGAFPGNQAHASAFFADQRDCARARPLAEAVRRRADLGAFGPDAAEWRALAEEALRICGAAR